MKKAAFILLSGLALLGVSSCKGDKAATPAPAGGGAIEAESFTPTTNIRYVVSDSINNNYVFAEEVQQQLQKIELDYRQYENQLGMQLQNMQAEIERKAQNNGYFSQESYNQDVTKYQQKAANYQQLLAKRQEEVVRQQAALAKALSDSVGNFIERYNREHHYDAILYKETCLYLNPALDITQEVVDGLNQAYHPGAAPAATDSVK